jgi:myo-inositol-1(or 4)-monophosphatase
LRSAALGAALKGSEVVWDALDKPKSIETKGGAADIVTQTDKKTEEVIIETLTKQFPDHRILGEEGGLIGNIESDYLWCIDPLDGTTNFAHSFPSFGVSVGLLHRGEPVAGSVVEFTGGPFAWNTRKFSAGKGLGATCNNVDIRVSSTNSVQDALLVSGFGYDHDEAWSLNMDFFKHFTDVSRGVRRLGAASVDLAQVALGLTEAYYEFYLKPWDVCAGILLVRESGGVVTTMDHVDRPYTCFDKSMIASNGSIHQEMMEHISPRVNKLHENGTDLKSKWFIPEAYKILD